MNDGPVARVQRVMPAAPHVVFDQWLDPESLAEWMCPRPVRCVAIDLEPRVGGHVRFDVDDSGNLVLITGRFLVIDRPRMLRFTWSASDWPDPTMNSVVTVAFEPVKEHIGAIVHVDKAHLCDDEVVEACRRALEECGVLVFPRINLTDAEQLAFTDKFGQRINFSKTVPGGKDADEEDVYKITLDKKINNEPEYVLGTFFWHMDGVTIDQPLPKATFLSARKLSPRARASSFLSRIAAIASRCGFSGVNPFASIPASSM